jgi:hypothetical protein
MQVAHPGASGQPSILLQRPSVRSKSLDGDTTNAKRAALMAARCSRRRALTDLDYSVTIASVSAPEPRAMSSRRTTSP